MWGAGVGKICTDAKRPLFIGISRIVSAFGGKAEMPQLQFQPRIWLMCSVQSQYVVFNMRLQVVSNRTVGG